jgi:ABC-type bacteriocin/lantibiotic exporter with double-glycine peptidase domain
VAAQVIVGRLLISFESLVKKMGHVFYFFTALTELDFVFSLPKDEHRVVRSVPLPDPAIHGIRLTCRDVSVGEPELAAFFEHFDLEITPGEKLGILTTSNQAKTTLARVLAGLEPPSSGVVRYNGVDLRHLDMDSINACRGFVLDSRLTLFEGTVEDNISLGRPSIAYSDLRWALRFTELEEEIDALPQGIKTHVRAEGAVFSPARIQKMLVARAIVTRPQILIFDGLLHNMHPIQRETLLRRLCSKEEPWSAVFISNDPALTPYIDRRIEIG